MLSLRKLYFTILLTALFFFTHSSLLAQDRCGTVEYRNSLINQQRLLNKASFENWLQQKTKTKALNLTLRTSAEPYRIPVVVHVIHKGEAIGTGTNISDAQIKSQIKVLNNDYNRTNTDAVNTPAVFQSLAGSMNIEFVLAMQDPNGLPTTGINRVLGTKTAWSMSDNTQLKALSYWPAEDYLNIWVCNLSGNLVGYSQFPQSDLPGLEDAPNNRLTDGVVIWYKAFGSIDDGNFSLDPDFNKGRTLTHEVGHFFGLLHTWGDESGCSGTDNVDDTPNQSASTSGCPLHPASDVCANPGPKMFQNFLDYTNDECMNLFTNGQIARMKIVIENSPRRTSLLSSTGDEEPVNTDILNIVLKELVSPIVTCNNTSAPVIRVRNAGLDVEKFKISYQLNNGSTEVATIQDLHFVLGNEIDIALPSLSFQDGLNTLKVILSEPNDQPDVIASDNEKTFNVLINKDADKIPLRQNFDSELNTPWSVVNSTGQNNWETISTNKNNSIYFKSYNNFNEGENAWLVSPVLDFSNVTQASMVFDISKASRSGIEDIVQVYVSTDCGYSFSKTIESDFESILNVDSEWRPTMDAQWSDNVVLNLSDYAGLKDIRIAFVVTNQNANNVYIDNIDFFATDSPQIIDLNDAFAVYGYNREYPELSELKITFNLPQRQAVDFSLVNAMGQTIEHQVLYDVLNQTYPLSTDNYIQPGIYFVRLKIGSKYYTTKVLLSR